MSRDDSGLYTGINSSSFGSTREAELKQRRALDKEKRLDTGIKLKPAAEPVLALIAKHKKSVMFVDNVAGGGELSDREAGELLRSQRAIYKFLVSFENEIKIALKDIT